MPRLSDIDFTIKYRPGRNLTGVEAKVAELTDSEPYALASVELGTSGFERVFDPRDYPNKEREVLDLAAALVAAVNAHEALVDSLEEILNYQGGADSALEDEYVMDRAEAALKLARAEP